ncbi:interleukin-36 receptor antagonist protein-like isoform X1 [Alligator sinensis]|uniref:Interleukin-1 n=2 Tax=Alligator sinensis TaxID=38654 RepID=A0A1U7SH20_ALLSI|nr:interleukin-36 receptor antagonist protein-like isoform X1 [Alligator sinensis]
MEEDLHVKATPRKPAQVHPPAPVPSHINSQAVTWGRTQPKPSRTTRCPGPTLTTAANYSDPMAAFGSRDKPRGSLSPMAVGQPKPAKGRQRDKDMEDLFDNFSCKETEPHVCVPMATPSPAPFTLRDVKQKVVCLRAQNLVAIQDDSNAAADTISVVPNQFMDRGNYPIIMGIEDGNRCLSCGTASEPQLQLENENIMTISNSQSDASRFTFFNTPQGNTHHFESAAYPGWFICTSQKSNEPVSLTNQLGQVNITDFYFSRNN